MKPSEKCSPILWNMLLRTWMNARFAEACLQGGRNAARR